MPASLLKELPEKKDGPLGQLCNISHFVTAHRNPLFNHRTLQVHKESE